MNVIATMRTYDSAWRLVVASALLLPGYGAVVGTLAYIGAVNKAKYAPALKGVGAIRLVCYL